MRPEHVPNGMFKLRNEQMPGQKDEVALHEPGKSESIRISVASGYERAPGSDRQTVSFGDRVTTADLSCRAGVNICGGQIVSPQPLLLRHLRLYRFLGRLVVARRRFGDVFALMVGVNAVN